MKIQGVRSKQLMELERAMFTGIVHSPSSDWWNWRELMNVVVVGNSVVVDLGSFPTPPHQTIK